MRQGLEAGQSEDARVLSYVFWGILAFAALLRLWNFNGPSLWMDEAISLSLAELPAHAIFLDRVDNHPPLHFLIQHLWQQIFPDPAVARLPAIAFGITTVYVVMAMLRDLVSLRAALLAGLLLALCTGHIYYSQEARMYSLVLFGLAVAAWGGIGQVEPGRRSPRGYALLYVIGGLVAIYAHILGLLAMAAIGFASLAGGLMAGGGVRFAREWLVRNIILFLLSLPWLVQIPANLGFAGLHQPTSIIKSIWYFKTITAFPGLGGFDNLFAPILYALAAASLALTWLGGRRTLALTMAGLFVIYPALLFLLSLDRPLIGARTLIPATLGVYLAAGIAISVLPGLRLRYGVAGLLVLAGLVSSGHHLANLIKPENFDAAFAHVDAAGYGDAPVLNCIDMSTSATWYARPEAEIYMYQRGGLMRYPGPDYWQAARMSMSRYGSSTAQEVDAFMGRGWLVTGGFEEAFGEAAQIAFIRPFCSEDSQRMIETRLAEMGFVVQSETLITEGAPSFQIMAWPRTWVTLYARPME
ncbi:MAG: glycosyltransferase family 39 protein [Hyphomonadaceae bacterium]|nr:glycosyltransferase family 39 protein [Hyphomonadaceae bacterium]